MPKPNILLAEKEVPIGVDVHLFMPGNETPDHMHGAPIVLRALYGGVPMRKKLYHIEGDRPLAGLEGFKEDILFSPAEVYNPANAPVNRRYLVFSSGKPFVHSQKEEFRSHQYETAKKDDGKLLVSCGFPFQPSGMSRFPIIQMEIERYNKRFPGDKLINVVNGLGQDMGNYRQIDREHPHLKEMVESGIPETHHKRWRALEGWRALEALAGRHRSKVAELIRVLDQCGREYLVELQLSPDAELVPLTTN